jgi:radical SAM superfamily enzyme YgiQ (UPF0313 family)
MKISLATSLHLNHSGVSLDSAPGGRLPMQSFVPMGLLSLKATADQANVGAEIRITEVNGLINAGRIHNDRYFYRHLVDAILAPDDAFVGLMTDADSLHHTLIIADQIKRRSPQTLVCLGGPASSPISRLILEAFPVVDFVVRGEGELTFVDLIRSLQTGSQHDKVLGLTWRDGDRAVENAERPLIDRLDSLPIPDFGAYGVVPEAPLYLDVGRGCPFNCSFCATAPFFKRRYRMKSIDRIVTELGLIRDTLSRCHVNFAHDIFTCDREWTYRFCDRLIDDDLKVSWTCSTRTDVIDPDLLKKMGEAGCVEIYYGIESGSPAIQRQIAKNLDLDWARQIIKSTVNAGIRPITGFIVGYPMETCATLNDTLRTFFEFLRIGGFRAHLFTLCPFPQSRMYREYRETVGRPAQYFDLPLESSAGALGGRLRLEHPAIFASSFRYAVPGLPARLVDASEELSAHLVLLKAIWPLLLPYYSSALEWYARWSDWIEADNAVHRPGTAFPTQGGAADLLRFVSQEIDRMGLSESAVAELVRYEQLKLDTFSLPTPCAQKRRGAGSNELSLDTAVVSRGRCLFGQFRHNIRALLAGDGQEASAAKDAWIIFAKAPEGHVTTVQLDELGKRILEMSDEPRPVGSLLVEALGDGADGASATPPEFLHGLMLVQQLINHGLLEEVAR